METLPAETALGESMVNMGSDESVLILIKHCQDMKQQETRLRLITLLLLLSCTALVLIFICGTNLRSHENSASSGRQLEPSPAYSLQKRVCPADPPNPLANFQRLHIHLRSLYTNETTDGLYIKWNAMFGEKYDQERRAIVIPEGGFYFVYVRFALRCHEQDRTVNTKRFIVELHKWNKGYQKTVILMDAWDGVSCTSEGSRTMFVGQLFDLLEGDHVSVWISEGYKLITRSSFGAYRT
uniref:uncharacterized protein LOC124052126 n=1 Tax=Scatophagus argus TaxID=75038 RepID=UPI001ED7E8FF|nr:uncharacterized protein LOC124052126 [Scatophagus argus]